MANPLKSFGCSFIYGTDLSDCGGGYDHASKLTYPALMASKLGLQYKCHAFGSRGNLFILHCIIYAIKCRTFQDQSPWIINWTYIDRFDYYLPDSDAYMPWCTILPNGQGTPTEKNYFENLHTEFIDKFRSLTYIYSAIQALKSEKIPFIMTYMDHLLFDTKFHTSGCIEFLQRQIEPHMTTFEGMDFLSWSKHKGFALGKTGHPVEDAHAAAADLMQPVIASILHRA